MSECSRKRNEKSRESRLPSEQTHTQKIEQLRGGGGEEEKLHLERMPVERERERKKHKKLKSKKQNKVKKTQ